jgi:hypothetical protein
MALPRLSAAAGFALLALVVTWPLPWHLTTHLPGTPTGDTGVYVWNVWIFRHEILRHARFPLFTDHIFALTNGTDLSVHNYTVFADLLALPLISTLGVVGAFNVIYLLLIATTGYATYLLVRRLTGGHLDAWIAGAAFAASPVLVARGTAHYSLVAAAPLPVFLLVLLRTLRTRRLLDALVLGLVVGWAGYCDVYYPIYCGLMSILVLAHYQWRLERASGPASVVLVRMINGLLVALAALIVWRLWHGDSPVTLFGQVIGVRTLYTPVLLLTLLGAGAVPLSPGRLVYLSITATLTAAMVLSPVLVGLGRRVVDGRFPSTPIYWRSSPPGLDLAELVLPNPNHAWFGGPSQAWIVATTPLAFPEFVGSLSLISLGIVGVALWRVRRAVPRFWIAFTLAFSLLALGPFIQIGRVNTYIPGPWALLRYVPVIGLARSPSRFAIVAALGLSVTLGLALTALRREWPGRWRLIQPILGLLLAFELVPAPRPLFDAAVPAVYARIAEDRDESFRVLELPTGVRDGTSSIGDFNASAQYFQTVHRKPLVGGYQSRVSERRKNANLNVPVLAALFALSEGRQLPADLAARARATTDEFLDMSCLGYVVIDQQRASPELRDFAIGLFNLVPLADDHGRELFVPARRAERAVCAARVRPQ